jgi:hypothetical protein
MTEIPLGNRPTTTIATYDAYPEAERAVDFLSDRGFPVERLAIVGYDLRLVEKVLGRLNWLRAALMGAGSGAWIGLFVGLLFAIFSVSATSAIVLILLSLLYGAVFGTVFGLLWYALSGGRRDFVSRSQIVPQRYDIVAEAEFAERAAALLTEAR